MDINRFNALHFEITNKCNLRCKHCYNIKYLVSEQKDLSTKEVFSIIDKAISAGCHDIGISGGEPFMRKDILDILNYASKFPIHILTNGLLITDEAMDSLQDFIIEFRISLDGLETHKLLRGIDYKDVINKIEALLNHDFVVTVNTMITNENLSELPQMYALMKELRVDRWRLDFIFEGGNAYTNKLVYKDTPFLMATIKEIISTYIDERPCFELDVNKIFRSSLLENAVNLTYTPDSKPCEYQGSLTVRPTGEVSFCPSLDITYGNLLHSELDEIIQNPEWKQFSNIQVSDLKECINCEFLSFCGGGCRADAYYEQGSFYKHSPLTCELVKFAVNEIHPLYVKA